MSQLAHYSQLIESALVAFSEQHRGATIHQPIDYILSIGGKRMRPVLALMSAELFHTPAEKAVPAALAVEVFHNFTLMHDDIMDKAPLRRGQVTVHEKWDTNTAILSGDAMLIQSYQLIGQYSAELPALLHIFNDTALGVCIGQQLDMEFEKRRDVSVEEYIEMIRLKTAVLLGGALEMGAVVAHAGEADREHIRLFGELFGISFQLRDDYLDAFGDPEKFGKRVGGDIVADKKTFLMIRAFEKADHAQRAAMEALQGPTEDEEAKIEQFKQLFVDLKVDQEILDRSKWYYQESLRHLEAIPGNTAVQNDLKSLAAQLLDRLS